MFRGQLTRALSEPSGGNPQNEPPIDENPDDGDDDDTRSASGPGQFDEKKSE